MWGFLFTLNITELSRSVYAYPWLYFILSYFPLSLLPCCLSILSCLCAPLTVSTSPFLFPVLQFKITLSRTVPSSPGKSQLLVKAKLCSWSNVEIASHLRCAYIKRDSTIEMLEMRAGKLGGVCHGMSLLHFRLVSTGLSTAEGGWWGVNESWKKPCGEHSSMSRIFWRQNMGSYALGLWDVGCTNSRPGFY